MSVAPRDRRAASFGLPAAAGAGGQGLALHGTMMAVLGGALLVEAPPVGGTRVRLSLPPPRLIC